MTKTGLDLAAGYATISLNKFFLKMLYFKKFFLMMVGISNEIVKFFEKNRCSFKKIF